MALQNLGILGREDLAMIDAVALLEDLTRRGVPLIPTPTKLIAEP